MGRVTYIHHYLPTLWFAVLMAGHVFDQLIFAHRRKYSELTKSIVFGISALAITGTFWWFRAISFGMTGPVRDYWGLQWRKVCDSGRSCFRCQEWFAHSCLVRIGTSTKLVCHAHVLPQMRGLQRRVRGLECSRRLICYLHTHLSLRSCFRLIYFTDGQTMY
jgi:hypothetical protein